MARQQSVVNLDPIDRKKQKGVIGRFLVTRYGGGKPIKKMDAFGHYMFCGSQGSGKTSSALWYAEKLAKRYKKRRIYYFDKEAEEYKKFDEVPKVKLYSNIDIGRHIDREKIVETIKNFDPYANEVRIVYLDEVHSYFPREAMDKETLKMMRELISLFSQLRKRNTYVISTAQVYGRLHKALREQCLYMINCKVSLGNKLVNDFIKGDDIICDELGRWAGDPRFIYKHGLPKNIYDTKHVIIS